MLIKSYDKDILQIQFKKNHILFEFAISGLDNHHYNNKRVKNPFHTRNEYKYYEFHTTFP